MVKTDFLDDTEELKPINVFFINEDDSNIDKIPNEFKGLLCRHIAKTDRGLGGGGASWCYVIPIYKSNGTINYPKGKNSRKAVYKTEDVDYLPGVFSEKKWSILGKVILPDTCRVPDINITVNSEDIKKSNGLFPGRGILSYNILRENEELIHISDLLEKSLYSEEIKKVKHLFVEDLLDLIKGEITDDEEYLKIEEAVIKTILLDAKTNNGDRNCDNWGLIRNIQTGRYSLALFDHHASLNPNFYNTNFKSFITSKRLKGSLDIETNEEIVKYIEENFPKYFDEFEKTYNEKIAELKSNIENSRNI